ncbi:MAG: hypothetical protein QM727_10050 [Niabella sp.]
MDFILEDTVLWIFDDDIPAFNMAEISFRQMAGHAALFNYTGNIFLTQHAILIEGEQNLSIKLAALNEIYLGFDEVYKPSYIKNFGLFWKPLRITYLANNIRTERVYLHIHQSLFGNRNAKWYNTIKSIIECPTDYPFDT